MKKGDFLKTIEGQKYRYFRRSLEKVRVIIPGSPKSKGAISSSEKITVQEAVVNGLYGHEAFRGNVALSLHFVVNGRNFPAIQTLPKNYLDLFILH